MRTRRAIVEAAQDLVRRGVVPTVPEAADAALVSRATAYRYFPTQAALLAAAAIVPGLPSAADVFDVPGAPSEAVERVGLVSDVVFDHVSAREREFRVFLRDQLLRSLENDTGGQPSHLGFHLPLVDEALRPLVGKVTPKALTRLTHAVGVLIGTEAVLAGRDVLGLDPATARADLRWACQALVAAALRESPSKRRAT